MLSMCIWQRLINILRIIGTKYQLLKSRKDILTHINYLRWVNFFLTHLCTYREISQQLDELSTLFLKWIIKNLVLKNISKIRFNHYNLFRNFGQKTDILFFLKRTLWLKIKCLSNEISVDAIFNVNYCKFSS